MSEPDKVNNKVIVAAVVLTSALLVALVVGVYQWFHFAVQDELHRKIYSLQSTELRELRAEDQGKLNRYSGWTRRRAFPSVRIPTDRAVELILSEGYQRPAPAPGAAR